jgi:protein-tyrosine phosphatase
VEGVVTDFSLPELALANASFVTDRLLVGGDLSWETELAVAQLHELVGAGVTHIIDARIEAEDAELVATFAEAMEVELEYLHNGIDDDGQPVPGAWFEACVGHALDAIEAGGRVLTHCHAGINRGPSLGYAVLLAQGWDPVEALARIVEVRPIVYVAYAEDALAWHHVRRSSTAEALELDMERLAEWRRANGLDLMSVLRLTRASDPLTDEERAPRT